MLRISLAFLSVALLLASTARAQMRGGGCASGSTGTGASSSLARTATVVGSNAAGYGTNLSAGYYGMGGVANASTAGAVSTNTSIAAAYYGMGGYGGDAWSNPYAQATNAYGISSWGFGEVNGMNDGPSSFARDESYLLGDPFAASLAAAERGSTDPTPRSKAKSTKAKSKAKRRVTRAKGTSR